MKTVRFDVVYMLMVALLIPSLARSFEGDPSQAANAAVVYMPRVEYRGSLAGGAQTDPAMTNYALGADEHNRDSARIRIFHTEGLTVSDTSNNLLVGSDRLSLTARAMTSRVNGILSLISTARQAQLDSGTTKWIQVLSLLATRNINAELAYSAPINKSSSIDSTISCNLHPGAAQMAAHVQYTFRF